ncbi:MAG: hypothetical protein ACOCWJ_01670 [Verrucomicrobiota bacterium]
MPQELLILIVEAFAVYLLVLWTHSLRHRVGLSFFYALLGGLTAIMSWITDAHVAVEVGNLTFMVGSTVFYTSLLLGVFVVYVFDGPPATRVAISTIAGVSILVPVIAALLHFQMQLTGSGTIAHVPVPSLRINTASVMATVMDLVFLAVAWEFFGRPQLHLRLWMRAFLTLLGVMWLDVILFSTGAFLGRGDYFSIMQATLVTRLVIALFAFPFLYLYISRQNKKSGCTIESRPVFAILHEIAEVRLELGLAEEEIQRRKDAEREKEALIEKLENTLAHVRKLEGLLPVCSSCHRIRLEDQDKPENQEHWMTLEEYVRENTDVKFSHGVCPDCMQKLYPDLPPEDETP